jgi:DNA primase
LFCVVVVESELDALLIQQEAGDLVYCIALGGSTRTPDLETHKLLQNTPQIFFCPDYYKAGAKAWIRWKQIFPNIKRLLNPSEKSPGDYFQSGGNNREWLKNNIKINHKVDVI